MNSNQYKQVAQTTMNQALESGADELTAVRAACDNLGVALPNGTSGEVAETLATNDYMGWRACTAEEAQAAANEGVAALYTDGEAVSLVLPDLEVTALGSGAYYTYNAASTTTVIPPVEEEEEEDEEEDEEVLAQQRLDAFVTWAMNAIGKTSSECAAYFGVSESSVPSEWCAWFVSRCIEKAGLDIPTNGSCSQLRGLYGEFDFDNEHKPKVGDIALISYAKDGAVGHTGIIVSIENGKIKTVEGNVNPVVKGPTNGGPQYNYSDGDSKNSSWGKIVRFCKNSL